MNLLELDYIIKEYNKFNILKNNKNYFYLLMR